jgi:hypothetical protein
VWAYVDRSKPLTGGSATEPESGALVAKLHDARQRLAALEAALPQQRAGG